MELDQFIFKKIYDLTRKIFSKGFSDSSESGKAKLSDCKDQFTILARAITGLQIELFPAEREGGISGNIFFLPDEYSRCSHLEDNLKFYVFRILYMGIEKSIEQNQRRPEWKLFSKSGDEPLDNFPLICNFILDEFPGTNDLVNSVIQSEKKFQREKAGSNAEEKTLDLSYLHGRRFPVQSRGKKFSSNDAGLLPEKPEAYTTEMNARPREVVNIHEENRRAASEYSLNHNFEKVETAEEFNGNWRDFDGSDELQLHKDALDEIDLRDAVRTDDVAHSVMQSEFFMMGKAGESCESDSKGFHVKYNEWDYSKKKYRKNYCKVFPAVHKEKSPEYYLNTKVKYRQTLSRIREKIGRLVNELEWVRNQEFGEDLDLDRVVNYFTDIYSRQTPDERIYIGKRKRKRDVSILLLNDLSLSTDSFVHNRRILDTEKQSLILFGEILSEFGDNFQIDGFYSRTRNHCDYITVKEFSESWDEAKICLGKLEPSGYTRIGPAIRHAKALIEKQDTKIKWILLLSDGKPNDYDRYEGKYGIEDVRVALKECRNSGVHVFALAIDQSAKNYIPGMFGNGFYRILPNPEMLPEALGDFYCRLLK